MWMAPDLNNPGIRENLLGIRSTLPALIASEAIQPEKNVFNRNFREYLSSMGIVSPMLTN